MSLQLLFYAVCTKQIISVSWGQRIMFGLVSSWSNSLLKKAVDERHGWSSDGVKISKAWKLRSVSRLFCRKVVQVEGYFSYYLASIWWFWVNVKDMAYGSCVTYKYKWFVCIKTWFYGDGLFLRPIVAHSVLSSQWLLCMTVLLLIFMTLCKKLASFSESVSRFLHPDSNFFCVVTVVECLAVWDLINVKSHYFQFDVQSQQLVEARQEADDATHQLQEVSCYYYFFFFYQKTYNFLLQCQI